MSTPLPDPTIIPQDQPEDIILACTLWGEARNQHDDARLGKGCVIKNRVISQKFGGTDYKAVCLARAQFSCWNFSDPNRAKVLEPLQNGSQEEWDGSYRIATIVLDGSVADSTHRSTHYHDYKDPYDHRVSWAHDARYVYVMDIGTTHFFRDSVIFGSGAV